MPWRPSTSLTITLVVTLALIVTAIGLGLRLGPGEPASAVVSAPSAALSGAAAGVEDVEPRVSVACPSVEARLTDVPPPAQATVSAELAAMDRQVQEVNAVLAGAPDTPGGSPEPVAFNVEPSGSPATLESLAPADLTAAADSLLGAEPAVYKNPSGFPRIPPITRWPLSAINPASFASARKALSSASSCRKNGTFMRERTAGSMSLR